MKRLLLVVVFALMSGPTHAGYVSSSGIDPNPFDDLPGEPLTGFYSEYQFDESDAGKHFNFVFEVKNTDDRRRLYSGWWAGADPIAYDFFNPGIFCHGHGNCPYWVEPGETIIYSLQLTNPLPDYLGRYPRVRMMVSAVPLPASGILMSGAAGLLAFGGWLRKRRGAA